MVHDSDSGRYEITVDGRPAGHTRYRRAGDVLTFVHTEIDAEFEGRGLGSRLVHDALADVRAQGVRVRPLCSFVAAYLERHPDEADVAD